MEYLTIIVQYNLPAVISLIGVIYTNKKSKEVAVEETKNNSDKIKREYETKMIEIEKNYETKMEKIESGYNIEIDKIKAESDKEIQRLGLEYDYQDKSEKDDAIIKILTGETDLTKGTTNIQELYQLAKKFGVDVDNLLKKI